MGARQVRKPADFFGRRLGLSAVTLAGFLLLPTALACSPPHVDPNSDFVVSTWIDGRVETNLGRDLIRLDLESGTWEPAGTFTGQGSSRSFHVTSPDGTIQLRYLMGNMCCLCGPYPAGLELVVGGNQVQTWGPPYRGSESQPWMDAFTWGNATHGIVLDADSGTMTAIPWADPAARWTVTLGPGDVLHAASGMTIYPTIYQLADGTLLLALGNERTRFLGLEGWVHDPLDLPIPGHGILNAWEPSTNATFHGFGWLARLELGPTGPSWTQVTLVPEYLHDVHRVAGGFLLRNLTHAWRLAGLQQPILPIPLEKGEAPMSLLDVGEGRTVILTTVEKQAHRVLVIGPDLAVEGEFARNDWRHAAEQWRMESASTGPSRADEASTSETATTSSLDPKTPASRAQPTPQFPLAVMIVALAFVARICRRA